MIAIVREMIFPGDRSRKTLSLVRSLCPAQHQEKRRAVLVVLTPPPVEPGEAPMNMKMRIIRMVSLARAPMSTVLNPAVRGTTDLKKAAKR